MNHQPAPASRARHLRAMSLDIDVAEHPLRAALQEARTSLANSIANAGSNLSRTSIATARAALSLGNHLAAQNAIGLAASHLDSPDQAKNPTGPETDAGSAGLERPYLRLIAEYLAWTGQIHIVRGEWPRVLRILDQDPRPAGDDTEWDQVRAILADAAESIGEKETAERIRGESTTPREPSTSMRDDSPNTWPEPGVEAEALVDYLVHELMGIEPDAPQNRLVLRPRIPEGWGSLRLSGLHFGDAEISLEYSHNGHQHSFTFEQESGAVPVTVIFEPELPETTLVRAAVDGQEAELDQLPAAGRIRVPIQIVLDYPRRVELVGGEGRRRGRVVLPVR